MVGPFKRNTLARLLASCILLLIGSSTRTYALPLDKNTSRVLFLFGGEIPETHPYATNALSILTRNGSLVVKAPLASPPLMGQEPFAALLIGDASAYEGLDVAKKQQIEMYCQRHHTGLIFLYVGQSIAVEHRTLMTSASRELHQFAIPAVDDVLVRLKSGSSSASPVSLPGYGRSFTWQAAAGFRAVASVVVDGKNQSIAVAKTGQDEVRKIWLGMDLFPFWLTDLLLLDSVSWVSHRQIAERLDHWIGIDIDDVFQPQWNNDADKRKVKLQAWDVEELRASQVRLSNIFMEPFHYNLGFNANWYKQRVSLPPFDDAAGDQALVAHAGEFRWFDHLPGHEVATNYDAAQLTALMAQSKTWAQTNGV